MDYEQQIRPGKMRQDNGVARDEETPQRTAVLHFLTQPHDLEPGKVRDLGCGVVVREKASSKRTSVLHFLSRPHGLEPGKELDVRDVDGLLMPASVTELLFEMRSAKRHSDHLEIAMVVYPALAIIAGILGAVDFHYMEQPAYISAVLLLCCTVNTAAQFMRFGTIQAAIARMMSRYTDMRVVGPLADALRLPDPETRHLSALALRFLLPRLHSHDAGLLTEAHRNILYREMRSRNIDLSLAILKALEQVGDAKAVPHVERLADTAERVDPRVRKAAEECLPFLLIRLEREIAPRILLRASSNVDTAPESLLRTATGPIDAETDLLLRTMDRDS